MTIRWPKALIFDVDGTLAETECVHLAAFNRAFAEFGLEWRWDRAIYGQLLTIAGSIERMRYFAGKCPSGRLRAINQEALFADLHRRKNVIYRELLRRGDAPLRPGVERLLREARQAGAKLAIATTSGSGNVDELLRATLGAQAPDWFSVIVAGDMVREKKPAPDAYELVLSQLGLGPRDCLAIEDSANGLRAAAAAVLPTVITVSEFTRGQCFDGAVLVVDTLGEPDRPSRVLRGRLKGCEYVSLAALARLRRRRVRVRVTYLQMRSPPVRPPIERPATDVFVMRARNPTLSFYRYLYGTIGGPWLWDLRRKMADGLLWEIIGNPKVFVHVLYAYGVPMGFVELDGRKAGEVEVAYFGLMPEAIGRGFGRFLIDWGVRAAWSLGPGRVWLHTCSLDHPRALATYQAAGFTEYDRETVVVPDPRDGPALADVKRFQSRVEPVP